MGQRGIFDQVERKWLTTFLVGNEQWRGKGIAKNKKHTSPLAWGGPDRNTGSLNGACALIHVQKTLS